MQNSSRRIQGLMNWQIDRRIPWMYVNIWRRLSFWIGSFGFFGRFLAFLRRKLGFHFCLSPGLFVSISGAAYQTASQSLPLKGFYIFTTFPSLKHNDKCEIVTWKLEDAPRHTVVQDIAELYGKGGKIKFQNLRFVWHVWFCFSWSTKIWLFYQFWRFKLWVFYIWNIIDSTIFLIWTGFCLIRVH